MNFIKYFIHLQRAMQKSSQFCKKVWAVEIKQKIDDQETRSYCLSIEINKQAPRILK
ncbi:hypothetical protein [Gilliamella sp. ESL0250]|uniref:hypothetical protein n=1 Tax=Gilliamella sp. ESL0250 TaxID=2705036 RepID=UPI001580728A|nr:hypothetical protein [Gilliamella sp. ESL0250]NUF49298.1 hypothetical protein [Gilliamella sp. ESL0250]